MDQGLKERLVGAAVLVAIGVWLIPWVLDGPEEPLETGASSLQLPAAEEPMPMRTQTLRLGGEAEPVAPAPAEPVAAAPEPPAEPAAESAAEPSEAAEVAVVEAAPPRQASPSAAPSAAAQTSDTPAPPVATPPKPAPSATSPRPAPAVAARGAWAVQLGSFSEEARARSVAQRTGTFGYKAAVTTIRSNGRTLYRVRVGPYAARGEADAAASALVAHGVKEARVVAAE
jgi:DedD protein